MNLTDFSSFFEIFAVLCFAYAGSTTFQEYLDGTTDRIRETFGHIKGKIGILEAEKLLLQAESENKYESIDKIGTSLGKLYDVRSAALSFGQFSSGFKTMFPMTGLFCLSVLLLGGFAQFIEDSETISTVLIILDLVLVYNVTLFFLSFSQMTVGKRIPVAIPIILLPTLLLTGLGLSTWCRGSHNYSMSERITILIFSLATATSPFVLHFLRTYIYQRRYGLLLRRELLPLEKLFMETQNDDVFELLVKETISKSP